MGSSRTSRHEEHSLNRRRAEPDTGAVSAAARPDTALTTERREALPHPDSLTDQSSIRGVVSPDTDAATATTVLVDAAPTAPVVPGGCRARRPGSDARPLGWTRRYVAVVAACDAMVGALAVMAALAFRPTSLR